MVRRRSKETVKEELERTKARLELYLERERKMLSESGVQSYTISSRSLQRYQTPLADIQSEIERLRKKIEELEDELAGRSVRRAVGVVPRDW